MPPIKPSARVYSAIRSQELSDDGQEAVSAYHEREAVQHQAVSQKAKRLLEDLRGEGDRTPWLQGPPHNGEHSDIETHYQLREIESNRDERGPVVGLFVRTSRKNATGLEASAEEQAGVFNRAGFDRGFRDLPLDYLGVSDYDGRPVNEYGLRYSSHYPLLSSESTTFIDFADTLDHIEAQAIKEGFLEPPRTAAALAIEAT